MDVQTKEEGYRRVDRRWLVQTSVGLGVVLTTIDTGGINVALHTLARYFAVDAPTIAWLPLLTFLVITSTLLLFGRLSDMLGSKRVFVAGFAVYGLGALMSGLAPSFPLLLAARGFQAVGISMLSANSNAILTECFPPHQRGMALGINSTLVGLGFFIGPIVGGFLINAMGWRYVFFATIPICLIGLVASSIILPRSIPKKDCRFDFLGAFLFALAAVSILLAANMVRSMPLTSPSVIGFATMALLAASSFIMVEKRTSEPMLELSLFRTRLFSFSLASAFFLFLGMAGNDFLAPLFIQQVLSIDPGTAGIAVSVVPFVRMFLSSPVGLLSDRFGSRWLTVLGCIATGIGLFGLSRMDASTALLMVVAYMGLVGLGTGFFFSPNMHATMVALPNDRLGMASGAVALRRNLGQSFGVAMAAFMLQSGSGGAGAAVPGFQLAFTVQVFCLGISALFAYAAGSTASIHRRAAARRATS